MCTWNSTALCVPGIVLIYVYLELCCSIWTWNSTALCVPGIVLLLSSIWWYEYKHPLLHHSPMVKYVITSLFYGKVCNLMCFTKLTDQFYDWLLHTDCTLCIYYRKIHKTNKLKNSLTLLLKHFDKYHHTTTVFKMHFLGRNILFSYIFEACTTWLLADSTPTHLSNALYKASSPCSLLI